MLIRGWRLNKKLKTTLPTHPSGKNFRFISFLVPVISRETLPLSEFLRGIRVRPRVDTKWRFQFFAKHDYRFLSAVIIAIIATFFA